MLACLTVVKLLKIFGLFVRGSFGGDSGTREGDSAAGSQFGRENKFEEAALYLEESYLGLTYIEESRDLSADPRTPNYGRRHSE